MSYVNFNNYPSSHGSGKSADLRDILNQIENAFALLPAPLTGGAPGFQNATLKNMKLENVEITGGTIGKISQAGGVTIAAHTLIFGDGTNALPAAATGGFLHIPVLAAAPTSVPEFWSSCVPICFVKATNRIYVYNGGWKSVAVA